MKASPGFAFAVLTTIVVACQATAVPTQIAWEPTVNASANADQHAGSDAYPQPDSGRQPNSVAAQPTRGRRAGARTSRR